MDDMRQSFEQYIQFMAQLEHEAARHGMRSAARRMNWAEFQRFFADASMPTELRDRWQQRLAEGGFERERTEVAATVSSIIGLLGGDAGSSGEAA